MRAWLWVVLLGSATIGLLAAATAFSIGQDEPASLQVWSQTARVPGSPDIIVCRFTVDSLSNTPQNLTVLRDVSMRLPRGFDHTFHVLDVQPRPHSLEMQLGSRIYHYKRWPIENQWNLRVRLRRRGEHRLGVTMRAADHLPSVQRIMVRTP